MNLQPADYKSAALPLSHISIYVSFISSWPQLDGAPHQLTVLTTNIHEKEMKGEYTMNSVLDGVGGRCGIRTHGSFTFFSFQDWCYRPLSQPSIWNRALFRQPLFGTRYEPSYVGRNKEWEVCMVNAQPLNHNMIISYIKEFVNYLLKYLQFCNNCIHWLYFEFVYISLQ